MPLYQNSVIYKLKNNLDYDDNNIYVGSTTNFRLRKNQHKNCCNNEKSKYYNFNVYQFIRENGGWDNWVMIPIEQYPCNSKEEKLIRERHHIDILRPILNIVKPGRTPKERYNDDKEKILEKRKEYYEYNKEKIKEKSKEYYEANKNKKIEKSNEYYEDNKEKVLERFKEKAICDHCGCEVLKYGLNRHQKTKKCINFVKS